MPIARMVRLAFLLATVVPPLAGAPVARADPASVGSLRPVGTPGWFRH